MFHSEPSIQELEAPLGSLRGESVAIFMRQINFTGAGLHLMIKNLKFEVKYCHLPDRSTEGERESERAVFWL